MPIEAADERQSRRLRLGMAGGGPGAFIAAVHRIAARLDDRYELVAAALSSDAERSLSGAKHLLPRAYRNFEKMEAFAQLYTDLAEQITAKIEKRSPNPESLLVPGVADGVEGMKFVNAVLESSRNRSAWTPIPASQ